MNKYGCEHFFIELLEQCSSDLLESREIHWIEKFNSFNYGYNATKGGDGRAFLSLPEEDICAQYLSGISLTEIGRKYSCDPNTIRKILLSNHIEIRTSYNQYSKRKRNPVKQINKHTGEVVNRFCSVLEAERAFGNNRSGHIGAVCRGVRTSAYGYLWEYDIA